MPAPRFVLIVRALAAALSFGLLFPLAPVVIGQAASSPTPQARAAPVPPVTAAEVRALWVLRTSLASPDQIARLVRDAKDSGFNTLLVQVRGRGDAWFAQGLEPRPPALAKAAADFDPLALTLTLARAAGLRVHAWVNVNLVASAVLLPRDRTHIVHAHPEWLMVPRPLARELARMNPRSPGYVARLTSWTRAHPAQLEGLYSSPVPAEAAHHVEAIVGDLARRYALDGLHLDYVRYPTADFDYSAAALEAFRAALLPDLTVSERTRLEARRARDPLAYADAYPERWTRYRQARLTDLVARLRQAVKRERPHALISAAVIPNAREATDHRLQDWPDWAARGLLDVICPMAYTPDVARFSAAVHGATRSAAPQALWAGIGAYRLDAAQTVKHIQAARAAGAHGIALFSYDSLTRPALRSIGRTAFRDPGLATASLHTGQAAAAAR